MAKLRIEVDDQDVLRVFVDDEQIGLIQSIEFSQTTGDAIPKLKIALPDMNLGWAHAETIKKLGFSEVLMVPLEK